MARTITVAADWRPPPSVVSQTVRMFRITQARFQPRGQTIPVFLPVYKSLPINRVKPSQTMPIGVATACRHFRPVPPVQASQNIRSSLLPCQTRLLLRGQTFPIFFARISPLPSTASNPVQPSQTMRIGVATACRHNMPRRGLVPQLCLKTIRQIRLIRRIGPISHKPLI
jgi:hypothetical protein